MLRNLARIVAFTLGVFAIWVLMGLTFSSASATEVVGMSLAVSGWIAGALLLIELWRR